jgi:hypothetical protein
MQTSRDPQSMRQPRRSSRRPLMAPDDPRLGGVAGDGPDCERGQTLGIGLSGPLKDSLAGAPSRGGNSIG